MTPQEKSVAVNPEDLKQCCARLYESDVAKLFLGNSFHPGGLKLTERVGQMLRLTAERRVLDVASGKGTSAMFLAERFGCEVVGVDYSQQNVEQANRGCAEKALARVRFQQADAEALPFQNGSFDAVVCECAFCTFPDKSRAAQEFARVLSSGGCVGISDLTRGPALPKELNGLLAWIACIADALPVDDYVRHCSLAQLSHTITELHNEALLETVRQVQGKLLGIEVMSGLEKLGFPGLDLTAAKQMANVALGAIQNRQLGYAIIVAEKE